MLFARQVGRQIAHAIENAVLRKQSVIIGTDQRTLCLDHFVFRIEQIQQGPATDIELLLIRLFGTAGRTHMLLQ